jgi:aryl-alcohol dehydrogenase-like predicted oxidoreductase
VKTIRFGRSGIELPAIGVGTWPHGGPLTRGGVPVGWGQQNDPLARDALVRAHDVGLVHWDTADVYGEGHSERIIGGVWNEVPRSDIFLASKVGWEAGPYDHFYHPRQVRTRFEQSLVNLRVDTIDLYYLHHCDFGPGDRYLDDALEVVRRFRDEGKIRFIGLSDWDNGKVARLADRVDPDAVQIYRSVLEDTYQSSGLADWVDANDVGAAFFSPLKHGLLLGKYESPATFEEGDVRNGIEAFRNLDLIAGLAANKAALERRFEGVDQPVESAILAPILADASTACALVGLRSPAQVEAAARVTVDLDPADVVWVRQQFEHLARLGGNGAP